MATIAGPWSLPSRPLPLRAANGLGPIVRHCGRRCSPSTRRTSRSRPAEHRARRRLRGSKRARAAGADWFTRGRGPANAALLRPGQVLTSLVNRLRLEQAWAETPAILQGALPAPIVIIGLPRTGTTLLQHLLAQDAAAPRAAELGRTASPAPPATPRRRRRPADRGVRAPGVKLLDYLLPTLGAAPGRPHAAHRVRDPVLQQLRQPRARHDPTSLAPLPPLLSSKRPWRALRHLQRQLLAPPVARPSGTVAAEFSPAHLFLGGRAADALPGVPTWPGRPIGTRSTCSTSFCSSSAVLLHGLRPPSASCEHGLGRGARADPTGLLDPMMSSPSTSTTPTSSAIRWAPCGASTRGSTSSSVPTPNRACVATSTSTLGAARQYTGTRSSSSGVDRPAARAGVPAPPVGRARAAARVGRHRPGDRRGARPRRRRRGTHLRRRAPGDREGPAHSVTAAGPGRDRPAPGLTAVRMPSTADRRQGTAATARATHGTRRRDAPCRRLTSTAFGATAHSGLSCAAPGPASGAIGSGHGLPERVRPGVRPGRRVHSARRPGRPRRQRRARRSPPSRSATTRASPSRCSPSCRCPATPSTTS